jgi:peptidoglycan/LPS O-acetylase OafA/YrhL
MPRTETQMTTVLARPDQHRADIQVLRALAVVLVVLQHARLPYLPGGFLGVDIFFVISGFLMTGLIDKGQTDGSFSLVGFYRRRARRLLPAAVATLTVTAILSDLLLDPYELERFVWQLVGSVTLVSNFVLWRQSFYFDSAAYLKPLLHMWSLSIEEQFYLAFPITMLVLRRRWHLAAALLLTALSAIACFYLVNRMPSPAFYLLPTRAWELGVGVCMALLLQHGVITAHRLPGVRVVCSGILIVIPMIATDRGHPGLFAAIICSATAVLMIPGSTVTARGVLMRPITAIGDRSYSLYLVHWPLFALAENIFLTPVPGAVRAVLVLVALVCTELQYRFVEQRFRRAPLGLPRLAVFIAVPLLLAVVSFVVAKESATVYTVARDNNVGLSPACDYRGVFTDRPDCRSAPAPHVMLWGDSIAMSLADGLAATVPDGIVQATRTVCGPVVGLAPSTWLYPRTWAQSCADFNASVLDYVEQHPEITTVVLASSLAQYVPGAEDLGWRVLENTGNAWVEHAQDMPTLLRHVSATVEAMRVAGKHVVLFAPPPSDDMDDARCLDRSGAGKLTIGAPPDCALSVAKYRRFRKSILDFLGALQDQRIVPVLYLDGYLCDASACRSHADGVPFYRDAVHLSHSGSRFIGKAMNWGKLIAKLAS